jgi:hypothetical protein
MSWKIEHGVFDDLLLNATKTLTSTIKRREIKKWDINLYLYICMFLRFVYKTSLASNSCKD